MATVGQPLQLADSGGSLTPAYVPPWSIQPVGAASGAIGPPHDTRAHPDDACDRPSPGPSRQRRPRPLEADPCLHTAQARYSVARRSPAGRRRARPPRGPRPAVASSHREAPFIASPAAGRRHRLLHVPQLRAGTRRLRDDRRQLPAAAGPVRRAELLQARSQRRLRDPRHQRRRRRRGPDVPVPVPERRYDDNQFNVGGKMVSIPLVQNGSADVSTPNSPALNVHEKYTLDIIRGPRRSGTPQPVTNADAGRHGVRQAGRQHRHRRRSRDYVALREPAHLRHRHSRLHGTGRVFVGQRKDPFVVNLGETFDLVNIKYPAVELNPLAEFATDDSLADANVTSLVLEVPIACLTEGKGTIIGGWTTASVPASAHVSSAPGQRARSDVADRRAGAGVAPRHAAGQRGRHRAQGQEPVQRQRAEGRRPVRRLRDQSDAAGAARGAVRRRGRQGADQLPAHRPGRGVPDRRRRASTSRPTSSSSEMLRLNTAIAPTAGAAQNRLGVLGGDNAGFPNGRRPGDDVVDIELRVAMGVLCTLNIGGCVPAERAGGLAQVHRRRVHHARRSSPTSFRTCARRSRARPTTTTR